MRTQAMRFITAARRLKRGARATWTRAFGQPVAVLNYHRINQKTPGDNNLTVTPEVFEAQIKVLSENYQVIPVSQIPQVIRNSNLRAHEKSFFRKPLIAITFDDGYLDTLTLALPILEKYKVPACVYVTAGRTDTQGEFWWDELESLLVEGNSQQIEAIQKLDWKMWGYSQTPRLDTQEAKMSVYHQLAACFKKSTPMQIEEWMLQLRLASGRETTSRLDYRVMTREELAKMARSPLIEIGSHTMTHPSLGRLSPAEQEYELSESKTLLETWLDKKVDSVAFPFGGYGDFNATTLAIAKRLGYHTAFTTVCGIVDAKSDLLAMPRMYIQEWTEQDFLRRLRKFLWLA